MWIRTVDPDDADGPLRDIYERVVSERGKLSDIMRVQSLAPRAMGAHLDLYLALLFGRSAMRSGSRRRSRMSAKPMSSHCARPVFPMKRSCTSTLLPRTSTTSTALRPASGSGPCPRRSAVTAMAPDTRDILQLDGQCPRGGTGEDPHFAVRPSGFKRSARSMSRIADATYNAPSAVTGNSMVFASQRVSRIISRTSSE